MLLFTGNLRLHLKKYDKHENKFYLTLKDEIDLDISLENETLSFNLNILKTYNTQDTSYYLIIVAKHRNKFFCSSILSKYVIIYDNKSLILEPSHYECDEDNVRKKYIFDFQINKNDLLSLENSKSIKILISCSDGELQGDFSEDNFEDFNNYIKSYVK